MISRILLIIFILIPALEIYLFIEVGGYVGALTTVLLIMLTAIIGVWMLRIQGMSTLMRFQENLQRGQLPAMELAEGVVLVACGAFLITPGFFTDAVGFSLLMPTIRRGLIRLFVATRAPSGMRQEEPVERTADGIRVVEGELIRPKDKE
jgi:UPF0716 protein FxsA